MSLYITGKSPYGAMDRLAGMANSSHKAFLDKAEDITKKVPTGLTAGDPIKMREAAQKALLAMDVAGAMTRMLIEVEQKKRQALQDIPT